MNEQEIRAMVRESISRALAGRQQESVQPGAPLVFVTDASHYRYPLPESDGPCLIEPAVRCNHCGYCQSHGH